MAGPEKGVQSAFAAELDTLEELREATVSLGMDAVLGGIEAITEGLEETDV